MNYPKEHDANITYRIKLIEEAEKDREMQGVLMAECIDDFLFWINSFGWTWDPRQTDNHLPFITYEYQDKFLLDIIDCIENGKDSITEKSRDMGFSWMIVAVHVYAFLFKKWSSLYGSYKEDFVDAQGNMDSFFERCRYMLSRLPKWMKPHDIIDKYTSIQSKTLGAEISGDSGQNFGTGGRRKFTTLDEFPLWQFAEKAFRKTRDISPCRIIGGTPEGKFNLYGKIMTNHPDFAHLEIKKFRLHWSLHPNKDQEWYENEKRNRLKLDVAKELDISYEDSVTGAVYPEFARIVRIGKYEFNPALPLYSSWDFGRDMTAILWFQHDTKTDSHYLIDCCQKSKTEMPEIQIEFFRAFVTGTLEQFNYNEKERELVEIHSRWVHKYAGHFGDPYNSESLTINARNSVADILREKNIHIKTNRESTLEDRITKGTLMMKKLYVNEKCTDFLQAITQSRYPKIPENSQSTTEKTKPIHDINSHYRTAYEYYCDNAPKLISVNLEELKEQRERVKGSYAGSFLRRKIDTGRRGR